MKKSLKNQTPFLKSLSNSLVSQNLLIPENNGQTVFMLSEIKLNVDLAGLFQLLKYSLTDGVLKPLVTLPQSSLLKKWFPALTLTWVAVVVDLVLLGTLCAETV